MKRLLPIFLAAFAVMACTGGSKDTKSTECSSPDRQMLQLRGNVLSVYEESLYCDSLGTPESEDEDCILRDTIFFDSEGKLIKGSFGYYTSDSYNVTRDSEGRITKLASIPEKADFEETFNLKYKDGILTSYTSEMVGELYSASEIKYTYDEQGLILTESIEGNSDELQFTVLTTYEYLEYDEQGNWTKANVVSKHHEFGYEYDESYTQYKLIKRKYQYE